VSVRPSVRPSVYTITLHNCIRLSWNFVHRIVLSISRSSSKMRMIRQEMTELSKKLSSLTRPSLRGGTGIFFQKKYFSQNYLKHIWIDSVFNADSEYDISFEPNRSFLTKHCLKKVSKYTKTVWVFPWETYHRYMTPLQIAWNLQGFVELGELIILV
jgi:hypothetical protein